MKKLKIKIKRKPACFLVLALICGILSSYGLLQLEFIFGLKLLLLLELIILLYYLFFKLKNNHSSIFIFLALILFFLGSYLTASSEFKYQSRYSVINYAGLKQAEIAAEISFDIGNLESDQLNLKVVKINDKKVKYGKIKVYSEKLNSFNEGDLIFLKLDLSKPAAALNPGGFSALDYLKKEGVYLQGWNASDLRLLKTKRSMKNIVISFKKRLLQNINYLFSPEKAAFIKAILLGEKEYLSYQQKNLLRGSGASHLLAISGLHMGIIILSFSFLLFKICSKKKTALYIITFLSFFYMLLVGAAVSIIRAALLALLFLWADEFKREGDFLNIISFTLIINLLLNPAALFSVSLQLSYLLVLALFYLTPFLNKFLAPILSVSLAAQLGAFAITAYYFNEYAWIAFITNLWLIPLISALLPLIFMIMLVSLFFINFLKPAVILVELSLDLLFSALKMMTAIQGRAFVVASPAVLLVIIYYLLLFALPLLYKNYIIELKAKKLKLWRQSLTVIFIFILILFFIKVDSGFLELNYLAVGQGDGAFIKFPGGKNMIVDTGPPGNDGRRVEYNLISFLNHEGIKKIDYLLISHFDADHVGGIAHLFARKEIKNILIPPFREKTIFHQQLEEILAKKNVNLIYLKEEMCFKIAGCSLEIYNPPRDHIFADRNENSIVFLLSYQQNKFLFTGDLSKKGEKRIIKEYQPGKIDILKAGHHGSNTSSCNEFLSHCQPKLAVISVGRNNFGHPAAAVLKRMEENKVNYLRTDQSGLIKAISNGREIRIKSFKELESSD